MVQEVVKKEVFDNRRVLESYCQTLSTDRESISVSREYDDHIGL